MSTSSTTNTSTAPGALVASETQAPSRRRRGTARTRLANIWPPALVLIGLVVAWEVLTTALSVSSTVLPGPALVLEATWQDRANLWPAMWTTRRV